MRPYLVPLCIYMLHPSRPSHRQHAGCIIKNDVVPGVIGAPGTSAEASLLHERLARPGALGSRPIDLFDIGSGVDGPLLFRTLCKAHPSRYCRLARGQSAMLYGNYVANGTIEIFARQYNQDARHHRQSQRMARPWKKQPPPPMIGVAVGCLSPFRQLRAVRTTCPSAVASFRTYYVYNNWDFQSAGVALRKAGTAIASTRRSKPISPNPIGMSDYSAPSIRKISRRKQPRRIRHEFSTRDMGRLGYAHAR